MKKILFVVALVWSLAAHAQVTPDEIKNVLAGKEWKIIKYEMFGVAEVPKPEQLNDGIYLKSDMTFTIIENGKEYKGKWSIMNPSVYINCKASTGGWSKMYKIISVGEKESVIEYKDPDLIKTKYYLELK